MRKLFIALTFLLVPACLSAQLGGKIYLQRADSLLEQVLSLYEVKKYGLLMETFHGIPNNKLHIQPTPVRKLLNKKYPSYGLIRQWCQVAYRFIKHPVTRSTKN